MRKQKKKKKHLFRYCEKSYVENEVMEYRVGGLGPHGMGTPGKGRHWLRSWCDWRSKLWQGVSCVKTGAEDFMQRRQQVYNIQKVTASLGIERHNGEPCGCRERVRRQWQEVRAESRTTSGWNLQDTARNLAFILDLWNSTEILNWHASFIQFTVLAGVTYSPSCPTHSSFLSPHLDGHQALFILSLNASQIGPLFISFPTVLALSHLNFPRRPPRGLPAQSLPELSDLDAVNQSKVLCLNLSLVSSAHWLGVKSGHHSQLLNTLPFSNTHHTHWTSCFTGNILKVPIFMYALPPPWNAILYLAIGNPSFKIHLKCHFFWEGFLDFIPCQILSKHLP